MRHLTIFALASLALPAAATAGETVRSSADQVQRSEQKRAAACAARDKDRPGRDSIARAECKVVRRVPPVVDPTPMFLP